MGLSEAACRLLHKIQSADAPSRLDDIFKQGVLGVPEALDLARTTVEDYERYDENFHAMDEKTRRMDTLRGIPTRPLTGPVESQFPKIPRGIGF